MSDSLKAKLALAHIISTVSDWPSSVSRPAQMQRKEKQILSFGGWISRHIIRTEDINGNQFWRLYHVQPQMATVITQEETESYAFSNTVIRHLLQKNRSMLQVYSCEQNRCCFLFFPWGRINSRYQLNKYTEKHLIINLSKSYEGK